MSNIKTKQESISRMYRVPVRIQDCAENKSKAQRVWITKYLQDTMASLFVYLLNAHNCPAEI